MSSDRFAHDDDTKEHDVIASDEHHDYTDDDDHDDTGRTDVTATGSDGDEPDADDAQRVGDDPFDRRDTKDRWESEQVRCDAPATVLPTGTAHNAPRTAPPDLLDTGSALWHDVAAKYELRADEVPLLAEMCRAVDRLAGIRAALVGQPLMMAGSTGQQRAHPLLGEERATVLVLAKLQSQLGLPDEAGQAGATPASRKATRAANERWRRESVVLDGSPA